MPGPRAQRTPSATPITLQQRAFAARRKDISAVVWASLKASAKRMEALTFESFVMGSLPLSKRHELEALEV